MNVFLERNRKMAKKYNTEETIKLILDTATRLFTEKGYEKTTIQDIVNELDGLSRGAIYHHFPSKEAIVDGVIKRLLPEKKYIEAISNRQDLNGLEKIQHLFLETLFNEEVGASFSLTYSLFNNPKFFMMYMMNCNEFIAPQIEVYLNEGNQDGSLNIQYPKQIGEIVVLLLSTWFIVSLYPNTVETFWEKLGASKYVLDGIGLPILSDDLIENIKKIMIEKEGAHENN